MSIDPQQISDALVDFATTYSIQIVGALLILVVGFFAARWLGDFVSRMCERKDLTPTLSRFLGDVVRITALIFVIVIALGKFGLSIAPLIALIGAMAFGASFALQGPLSNYGAGLTIIFTRPFIVGDTITLNEVSGVVEEIKLACTYLITEDSERVIIPNKRIIGEILINSFPNKVVEGSVSIAHGSDPLAAIAAIQAAIATFEDLPREPDPQVGIEAFAESAVLIGYRYWVPTKRYFQISFAINAAVFAALKQAEVELFVPTREVRVISRSQELA